MVEYNRANMSSVAQNLAVILIVGVCAVYVGYQAFQAMRGRKSKLGSCCAKGCDAGARKGAELEARPAEQFIPLAALARRARK
jgi:hypothetical protein